MITEMTQYNNNYWEINREMNVFNTSQGVLVFVVT